MSVPEIVTLCAKKLSNVILVNEFYKKNLFMDVSNIFLVLDSRFCVFI